MNPFASAALASGKSNIDMAMVSSQLGLPWSSPLLILILLLMGWLIKKLSTIVFCRNALPGPRAWPVVGNIYSLGRNPHVKLTSLRDVYGDVYNLRMGCWDTIVINGYKTVREALVRQKDTFASRPPFHSYQYYSGGLSMSFSPYNDVLASHRKFMSRAIKELMNQNTVTEIIHREALCIREKWRVISDTAGNGEGANEARKVKRNKHPSAVSKTISADLTFAIGSILYSVCFGADEHLVDNIELTSLLLNANPATELFAAGNQVDFAPWMRFFTQRKTYQENVKRMKTIVNVNRKAIQEAFNLSRSSRNKNIADFVYDHISGNRSKKYSLLGNRRLEASTVEFLSAGTETSSATLEWLLLYMAKYPEVQERSREEILDVIGDDFLPDYKDRYSLPFTHACILEVMRMSTIVPFALPHYTIKDTEICGYKIAKNTVTWANLWSVNYDPEVWDEPEAFYPERFLTSNGIDQQVAGKCLSFSAGKRRCIGEHLGRSQVFIMFVSIVQNFQILPSNPYGIKLDALFGDILKPKYFEVALKEIS